MNLSGYETAWSRFDFKTYFLNTAFVAVVTTVFTVFVSACTGFALAKYDSRWVRVFFLLILATTMLPTRRPVETVALRTSMQATVETDGVELHWEFEGPKTPVCLLLALDGGDLGPGLPVDEHGRRILEPGADAATEARCTLRGQGERLEIAAAGQLGGRAFYDPGEAYSFLGASDEPGGDALLIPASTATPLTLRLRLISTLRD